MINGGGLPRGLAFVAVVLSFADVWLLLMLFDLFDSSVAACDCFQKHTPMFAMVRDEISFS
jgi:hypothetical protein